MSDSVAPTALLRRLQTLLTDAYASLVARPGRSSAMVAGIVLGVASATAAVLVADTQQAQIDGRFDLQRASHVVIQAQQPSPDGFDPGAVADVAALPVVSAVGEVSVWRSHARVAATPASAPIGLPLVVLDPGGARAIHIDDVSGPSIDGVGTVGSRPIVWVGRQAAIRLGIDPARGPTTVTVGAQTFSVAGVITAKGAYEYVNSAVIASRPLAVTRWGGPETVRLIADVRPGSAAAVGAFARVRVDPTQTLMVADATPPDGQLLLGAVTTDLRAAGLAVGAFVGLVGMITVANTLTMSVTQRTRELGLRSAMGWSRRRIAGLILIESLVAGAAASVIGCASGMAAAALWSAVQGWQLVVAPQLAPMTIGGGVLACVLGGLLPAHRAAVIPPMTAMRD